MATPRLKMTVKTWTRDSHNLFDYESHDVVSQEFHLSGGGILFRNGERTEWTEESVPMLNPLLSVVHQESEFYLNGPEEGIWHILRDSQQPTLLSEGSVIKLGRVSLQVKTVCHSDSLGNDTQDSSEDDVDMENAPRQCKICLGEEDEQGNPLIKPCYCSGSIQYIHVECLQKWINSRKTVNVTDNSANYYWKSNSCELCKQKYPDKVPKAGQVVDLLIREYKEAPYITLEPVNNNKLQGIYLVSFLKQGPAKIGRGHDCDVKVPDISVSRTHATISLKEDGFVLEDKSSKFGSLLMQKGPWKVEEGQTVKIQAGRSIIEIIKLSDYV